VIRAAVIIVVAAIAGWVVAVASSAVSAYVVSIWSGDASFVHALGWESLGTWGMFGTLIGMVCGSIGFALWLRRLDLSQTLRALPALVGWTVAGGIAGAVILFPLALVGAAGAFFRCCARAARVSERSPGAAT
jgi:hypothetical protein